MGTAVSGPTVSGNCKCFSGTETTVRSYSFRADNCKILQFQGHAHKSIHFLKAHVKSFSKTATATWHKYKDNGNYKYEDEDKDKEIESCTSDSPTPPNPYIFWKLMSRAIQKRQRDTNTKSMTITNTKTKAKTRTPRQYLIHLQCAIFSESWWLAQSSPALPRTI